jgi:ribonuclease J
MRACIRRGAHQIGGTCIELESQGQRIVLDIGLPLDAEPDPSLVPAVPGLVSADESLLAVFISHAHRDHYGLLAFAQARPQVFIGEAAARMLEAASLFWPGAVGLGETEPLHDREPIEIGPFRVTPYLVDHSAYDAYALFVEADGERVFYSGDLRAHGRKGKLFERLLRDGPRGVDALLLEGTTLGWTADERNLSESDLEEEMVGLFRDTPGLVLLQASAMNIDRLVTVFRACLKANRQFIIDMYAASVLRASGNERLPQGEWEGVRVYLPRFQKQAVIKAEAFALSESFKDARIYPEALAREAGRSVMLFRPSMRGDLEAADCLEGAHLVYSQWRGYLEQEDQRPYLEWLAGRGIPLFHCHTSGHASASDLERLCRELAPAKVVPVHSEVPERYAELFENVVLRGDGLWWGVA